MSRARAHEIFRSHRLISAQSVLDVLQLLAAFFFVSVTVRRVGLRSFLSCFRPVLSDIAVTFAVTAKLSVMPSSVVSLSASSMSQLFSSMEVIPVKKCFVQTGSSPMSTASSKRKCLRARLPTRILVERAERQTGSRDGRLSTWSLKRSARQARGGYANSYAGHSEVKRTWLDYRVEHSRSISDRPTRTFVTASNMEIETELNETSRFLRMQIDAVNQGC